MDVDPPMDASPPSPLISDDDLPAGHPMLYPAHEVCIISRCDEMDAEEARLRLAVLAVAPGGDGQEILTDGVLNTVRNMTGIDGRGLIIRKFFPEQFLIIFTTPADRDCAVRTGWVNIGMTLFLLLPWTCLVRAEADTLRFCFAIEIEGIPAHTASLHTARKILSSSRSLLRGHV